MELTAGGKGVTEVKIQREMFQTDMPSPLLFVIAMMPLSHTYLGMHRRTQTNESQESIIINIESIKLFVKNEKELETPIQTVRIYREDIGMGFGIEKCSHDNNEKWKTSHD